MLFAAGWEGDDVGGADSVMLVGVDDAGSFALVLRFPFLSWLRAAMILLLSLLDDSLGRQRPQKKGRLELATEDVGSRLWELLLFKKTRLIGTLPPRSSSNDDPCYRP